MKKLFVFLLAAVCFSVVCAAGNVKGKLSSKFDLYVNAPLTEADAIALSLGKKPAAKRIEITPGQDGLVNIARSGAVYKNRNRTPALLEATLIAENDGKIQIGAGADWWFACYVNGKMVFSTMAAGNGIPCISKDNHPILIDVKKGENKVVLLVHSGSGGWSAAMGLLNLDEVEKISVPYLTHADAGSVTVNFLTSEKVVSFVDYRIKGEQKWLRTYELFGGQTRIDTDKHTIRLTGLKNDTVYEYRPGIQEIPNRPKEDHGNVYTFRSFSDEPVEFSLFYTSDTQFPYMRRMELLREFRKNCGADKADLIVHGGDVDTGYDNAKWVYWDSYIKVLAEKQTRSIPLAVVRGNHEYRGMQSIEYFRYFGGVRQKSYYMFRQGNVCFIMLDGGEDKPRYAKDILLARTFDAGLMTEQREWLEKEVIPSKAFQTAKFRVILTHSPGHERYSRNALKVMTDGLFTGKNPAHKIHLWLTAHTHIYTRNTVPGGNKLMGVTKRVVRNVPAYDNSIVVINDGPGGGDNCNVSGLNLQFRENGIEVKAMFHSGKVFDHFTVLPDGTLKEHKTALKVFSRQ